MGWPLESIQHTQAIISCLCVTVQERTHCSVISDKLSVRHLIKRCAHDKEGERNKQTYKPACGRREADLGPPGLPGEKT